MVQVRFRDSIHKAHECYWGVSEPKGYHYELIMPISGAERTLRYIFIFDSKLVIPRLKVYLRESPRTSELVEEVTYNLLTVFDSFIFNSL